MTWLSDAALERLRSAATAPDLGNSRYELAEPIGRGGMGTIYRAVDGVLGREVAVKVMRDGLQNASSVARMRNEAHVIARLEHPGIVPVHDVGLMPDGRVYYVMKLVRGRRLDECSAPPAALDERLRVFERICETVAFAHARGVIHRDLKPQNIMVGSFGEVLILDWGVAKLIRGGMASPGGADGRTTEAVTDESTPEQDTRTRHTAHGTVIGTPAYMPPEQARGEVDRVSERSDVYALGAILCFLLTGSRPVTQPPLAPASVEEPPVGRPPVPWLRTVPRALAAVCEKAMHPDPVERYAGAGELAAEIVRFRTGRRVTAHREGLLERMRRLGWKYATPLALVLAYLLMRILLAIFRES
jgi:serine/threonine protein kinase